ncbi:MAG: pyridoxal phosphate-dependent aminotransferase [Candidimonas sp.]
MGFFTSRIGRLKPSLTSGSAARARALLAQGRNIIILTTGEPDFDTPAHIIEAAYSAMKSGQTRYTSTDGTPELKQAICDKFKRENGLDCSPSNITVSTGAKQIIFNIFSTTVETGDEVVIPAPYWVSYPDIVGYCGGTAITIACTADDRFKLTPEKLEASITRRTKWLVLNSPCNPSGAVYTRGELKELGDVLRRHEHVWVLSDDIYEHLRYTDDEYATIAHVNPDLAERVVTLNGVSKAYAMTGWRIGYAAGPEALIKKLSVLQSQSTSSPSSIGQAGALAALTGGNDFMASWNQQYRDRRDHVTAALNAIPGLRCSVPDGAFYAYPMCDGLLGSRSREGHVLSDDTAVADYFLERAGVAVVPGTGFGLSPAFRVSFATSKTLLEDACARIAQACMELEPEHPGAH